MYIALGDSSQFVCCEGSAPSDEAQIIQAVIDLVLSRGRRGGLRLLRAIFRRARRELVQNTANDI